MVEFIIVYFSLFLDINGVYFVGGDGNCLKKVLMWIVVFCCDVVCWIIISKDFCIVKNWVFGKISCFCKEGFFDGVLVIYYNCKLFIKI